MRKDFLLSAIGDIDDDLIAEAAYIRPPRRVPLWAKYTAAAACLCLCAVAVLSFPALMRSGSMAPESANKQDAAVMDRDDFFYTAEDEARDTVDGILMQGVNFLFFDKDGDTRYLWWNYPDGIVSTEEVLSAYLREAGVDIACLSVIRETEGEKDEIRDYGGESVIVHTMGVTTVTVTLDGIPQEHVLRGLGETVRGFGLGNVKKVIVLAEGEEIWQGEW